MNALYSLIDKGALSKRLDELSKCLNIPTRLLDAQGKQLEQHGETDAYCALLKARVFARRTARRRISRLEKLPMSWAKAMFSAAMPSLTTSPFPW